MVMHPRTSRLNTSGLRRSGQSGVVLFVALMLLVILSMIAVTVARLQTVEERMARNDDSRQLALQAAEAALRNGEDLLSNAPSTSTFAGDTAGYFALPSAPTTGSLVAAPGFWSNAANYINYNGPVLGAVQTPVQTPKIVMELVGFTAIPGDTLGGSQPTYRVTVQGISPDGTPSIILQSIYR
jgi:type IV pilus assembly protein PilX